MLRITLQLFVGVLVLGVTLCDIRCPDGNTCPDLTTCCLTSLGYRCCPYPRAVCCSDKSHCCPSGYRCNLAAQKCDKADQPWLSLPLAKKEAAVEPSSPVLPVIPLQDAESNHVPEETKSTYVRCDSYFSCPDRTTCCRHPKGAWFCCPYYPGRCCLDGFHCCPYGYDCDLTYTHCVRNTLMYPFPPKQALSSVPASRISTPEDKGSLEEAPMTTLTEALSSPSDERVIRCDATFYCPGGRSCCKGTSGNWNCCPFPLGQCCADGKHCCEYGYTCDPSSSTCRKWYSEVPAGAQEDARML
ncbi:progranulin-like [Acanthochromis polyacanthus]|uniref:Granulins-like n=1 Tax=Acanthochromis polyacanthus TaxID=80966 RepID=A0A3Q1GI66_9TELE|nr:progranulin-like [Acanthochromis polyacanthus]